MNIQTEYAPGDTIFYKKLGRGEVESGIVLMLEIKQFKNSVYVCYTLQDGTLVQGKETVKQ